MGEKAVAVLVFPGIVKGGFIVGGQYGEGALIQNGKTVGFYNTVAASYGLQAGLQKFGYALFFMTEPRSNGSIKAMGGKSVSVPASLWLTSGRLRP